MSWECQGRQEHGWFGHGTCADAMTVALPPGRYFEPLIPLMTRILAVRPGDDVTELRHDIDAAFYAVGDTTGGNQVNALLSDLVEPGVSVPDRRGIAEELAHFARTDPQLVGMFRASLAYGVIGAVRRPPAGKNVERNDKLMARAEADRASSVADRISRPVGVLRRPKTQDAHRIIQDAAVRDIPNYSSDEAPGIILKGPSTQRILLTIEPPWCNGRPVEEPMARSGRSPTMRYGQEVYRKRMQIGPSRKQTTTFMASE